MASDSKALAAAAKAKGNACFGKKTKAGYEEALAAYEEAIGHDPDDHVFYANCCACYLELAADAWKPFQKTENYARALSKARQCTARGPSWVKGYIRQSTAEFELIGAVAKWEERKKQDEKWRKEDEERIEKDRKAGREPYIPPKSDEEPTELEPAIKEIVDSASYGSCETSCRTGLQLELGNQALRERLQALRDAGHAVDVEKDKELRDQAKAGEFKALGNAAFSGKNWRDAAAEYTKALAQDPFDHVFYSNRSACYAEQEEYDKALRDAEKCISLNPQFAKGYSRKALALYHLGQYSDMEDTAKAGLAVDSNSAVLQDLLKQAQVETAETLEVQKHLHELRKQKKQDAKMQDLMRGLNLQGHNLQCFSPGQLQGADLSSLLSGGGGGFGGGNAGKAAMTEEQMRGMARAMAQHTTAPAATAPADGPASFSPA